MSTALTLRISGIPTVLSAGQFIDILATFIDKNIEGERGGENIVLWSFAPSATSADREKERVATVTLLETPQILRQGNSINLQQPGTEHPFTVLVDTDFYGLTPLNNPTAEVNVDIIAVTGLAGHAFGSWKSRGAPTMWLRDFLPQYLPTARILTYGYDSTLFGGDSSSSIRDFSGRFLEALKTARAQKDERNRAIIFIGHSLGGLVIKQALVKAARGSKKDNEIFSSCYGLLFFGVPNRGLHINALRSMVKGQPNSRLVEDLDPASTTLRLLHDSFSDYFNFQDSRIVSIFETKETKTVMESSQKGVWERTGPRILMVPEESATYSGPTEKRYDQLSINANHSDITKFSHHRSPDFLTIRQRIAELVEEAPVAIKKRFEALGQCPSELQAQLQGRVNGLLSPINFDVDIVYRSEDHCEGTGDWLLSDPYFKRWRDILSSEILWLHGSPGSGKTYLMSRVLKHIKEYYGTQVAVAYFFCDNKTEKPETRETPFIIKTLVSQLLSQILPSHPDDVELCLQQFKEFGDQNRMIPWLFRDTLKRISKHLPKVFLVLDALDECDDFYNLLDLLRKLGNIHTTTFQIILAGRPIDSIRSQISSLDGIVRSIELSPEKAKHDVTTFIHMKVLELDIRDFGSGGEAARRLIDGCDSLFLLAHFRIESLKRTKIHTQQDLENTLSTLPQDLTKFYDKTLDRIRHLPHHDHVLLRKIFMWITYAKRQLSFGELAEAVSIHFSDERSFGPSQRLTQRGLDELCGGLVVLKPQDNLGPLGAVIGLAHKTVKEYIVDFVWKTTPPSPCLNDQNTCSSEIVQLVLAYMCGIGDQKLDSCKFLDYAYSFWILHLFDLNKPTPPCMNDLAKFMGSENCFSWWNSPISATLNATEEDRRYLQSRLHGWITTNVAKDSELHSHINFMTRQQEKQVAFLVKEKGEMHVDTVQATENLALTYSSQGRWRKAEDLEARVMTARKNALGDDHPDSLTAMGHLASINWKQGRWEEASELQALVMATRKSDLGEDHPETLTAMSELAVTYRSQGRWKEAESLQAQVVATRIRILGDDHPKTLKAMDELAVTYRSQGRWKEAEDLQVQVVATSKRDLGHDYPDTLTAIGGLAATYWCLGRWKEAEGLQIQVMNTRKRVLGEDHPETLGAMSELAVTYRSQGRWEEAEDLQMGLVATTQRVLGKDHPDTLVAMGNLAATYWNQVQLKKAEKLQSQLVDACNESLGEDHPVTLKAMGNLAMTYFSQIKYQKAEELQAQVVEVSKRTLGESHPDTLAAIANLAYTYVVRNLRRNHEIGLSLQVQVIATSKIVLGEHHPDTLEAMARLARTYINWGEYTKASDLQEQVVTMRGALLGEEHPDTLRAIRTQSVNLFRQGRLREAEAMQDQLVATSKRVLGEDHYETLMAVRNLSATYWKQGRRAEAARLATSTVRVGELGVHLSIRRDQSAFSGLRFSWSGRF